MIGVSPFAKIILSEAKDLGVRAVEILRYAQDDDFGGLSPMLMHNVENARATRSQGIAQRFLRVSVSPW